MTRRLASVFVLLAGLVGDGVDRAFGERFEIESVTFIDIGGLTKTTAFNAMNISQIPASAVKNVIIINGTYGPARSAVTATINLTQPGNRIAAAMPECKNGKWSLTIRANALSTNSHYDITSGKLGRPSTAGVNGVNVAVTAKTLVIAIND